MERLKKAGEWLSPVNKSEFDYRADFPVIEITPQEAKSVPQALNMGIETLLSFAETKKIKPEKLWTMYDVDFVLRDPPEELFSICPGRLPNQSIRLLKELENRGVSIGAFATNQPVEGHQIAKAVGKLKNYRPISEVLKKEFPDSLLISAEKAWSFLWQRPKTNPENAQTIADVINKSDYQLYAFFGDRYDVDAAFWKSVQKLVPEKDNQFVFVKLPNPGMKLPAFSKYSFLIP
jgi:hypothetical protein